MRKKSLIRRLIPWIIALAVIGGLVYVGFLIYGHEKTVHDRTPEVSYNNYDEEKAPHLVMENDYLLFDLDPVTTKFQVTEKANNRVWYSNPPDADKDPIANGQFKEELSSTLRVVYNDSTGVETRINNVTKSIKDLAYTVEQQEDGSVRVNYSVGEIEPIYKMPIAVPKERFDEIKSMITAGNEKKQFENAYSKIDPKKLSDRKDKDQLIKMYPEVENQVMYVIKDSDKLKRSNKKDIEGKLKSYGYTDEDYEADLQYVAVKPDNSGAVFNISMVYRLDGPDLIVEIPYDDIRYKAEYPLTYINPLPAFNAVAGKEDGFLMIPEGGGAIIHYGNGKLSQNPYYANLYGWDYGIERKEAISETENAFPVFGATCGDASYICIIESGSAYSGVNADIAGEGHNNNFNTVSAQYSVLHSAPYNVSNKTAKAFYVYEAEVPSDTIRQRYRFINSNKYADMANAYGDYLRENVTQLAGAKSGEDMPVNIELIGAINKRVIKFGVPVDSVVATTTFEQARKIVDELSDKGVRGLSVRMTGWSNGGIRQEVLTGVHVLGALGGESEMKSLIAEARLRNIDLYFDGITCFAYHSGLTDGFIPFRDAARYATRDQVHLYPYNIVNGQTVEDQDDYYLVKPSYAQKNASNLIEKLNDMNSAGIAFRDIGKLLSADYYPNDLVTREMVKQMNIETMEEAAGKKLKVMIKEGNDYAVPYADRITDMNLTGQAYGIIDERIPFYQIALHGLKDYTGEPINLSGDYKTMLLECAEYGAGLNFTFMAENTRVLMDSVYSEYTSSGYDFWKDQVFDMIQRYQTEMGGLNQLRITGHDRIAGEVTLTVYEDGTKVYVNYGNNDYTQDDTVVPARDYLVVKGEE